MNLLDFRHALHRLDLPPFRPLAPWLGGDLQTLRNLLRPPAADLPPATELVLPLGDGDALIGHLHDGAGGPLVLLIHGLSGSAASDHVMVSARHLLTQGHSVLRLDLRGAGASQRVSSGRYHAGRSEDLARALDVLPASLKAQGLVLVGYSLGGNMIIKYLGEDQVDAAIRGAVAISAPFDLGVASRRIQHRRNWPYHRYLLAALKREALAPRAALTDAQQQAIRRSRSIFEFDEYFVAPANGFAGAEDYYLHCSARRYVAGVEVPTLVLHALDDPWIPPSAYDEVDWAALSTVRLVLTPSGGHVGFHAAGLSVPWHDHAIAAVAALFR
jgi:predicted alpha/beta-fold hydrolase